eukprot:GFUD01043466.1.p1 GENE.GFUD01043466.1~~GFUD01043466.1.p1  ORF type:complete len:837 (+),score=156.43 GFUD01043466.1:125-2635(+)
MQIRRLYICFLLTTAGIDGCGRRKLPASVRNYLKPPMVVYRSHKFPSFNKLQLVLQGKDLDNIERYSRKDYRKYIYKGKIIHEANGDFTKISALNINKVYTGIRAGVAAIEVTWSLERFHPEIVNNETTNNTAESLREGPSFSNFTFKVKTSELKTCFRQLSISKSEEAVLVFTCYQWSGGPQIFLLSFLSLLGVFYLLLPPLLATLYIRSVQGKSNCCFLVPNSCEQQLLPSEDSRMTGNYLTCYLVCGVISVCVVAALITFSTMTDYALNKNNTNMVLNVNLSIRAVISLLLLAALLCFTQLTNGMKLWEFPLYKLVKPWFYFILEIKNDDDGRCCVFIMILFIPFITLELAFFLIRLVLKIFHYILFGGALYLSVRLQNLYILKTNPKFDAKELLHYGYLSHKEKIQWMSKVESYVSVIITSLKSKSLLKYLLLNNKILSKIEKIYVEPVQEVSFLHTGSITEQLGKPMMVFGDLERSVTNSFPRLRSDHDVMLVLEHLLVYNEGTQNQQEGFWLKGEVMDRGGKGEFVRIIPMVGFSKLAPHLSNKDASDFLVELLSDTFFKNGKITDAGKKLPIQMNMRELGESLNSTFVEPISNKVLITRAGPSVNMKVTGHRGLVVFDCDFLLSLPVTGWPAQAWEWRTRKRIWPNQKTVDWLASLPCHLIPKPASKGNQESWRYSFSRQEIELAIILPHEARLCYIGLKHIFKKYLVSSFSGLKSYHMLTLFFWFMEDGNHSAAFDTMLRSLLQFVAKYLRCEYIPHYFIRSINLVTVMKVDSNKNHNLKAVSKTIQEILERRNISEKYIFDEMAFHTMALNRSLHERVLRERCSDAG